MIHLAILFSFLFSNCVFGEIYFPDPDSRLHLGSGFNRFQSNKALLQCLSWDDVVSSSGGRLQSSSLEISGVSSMRELHQKVGVSAFFKGSFLFGKIGASMRYSFEKDFAENSLNWLVSLKLDYGTYTLLNPKLKEEFQSLEPLELISQCGHEFVTEEKRGIQVFALLSMRNVAESQKKELETKLSVLSKGFFYDASFEASYKDFMTKAHSLGEISIKIFARGGKGLGEFEGLLGVNSFMNFGQILESFNHYIKNTEACEAVPTLYATTELKHFSQLSLPVQAFEKEVLVDLYYRYLELEQMFTRAKVLLGELDFARGGFQKDLKTLKNSLFYLKERASRFLKEKEDISYLREDSSLEEARTLVRNLECELQRQKALRFGLIEDTAYRMLRRRNLYPVFVGKAWENGGHFKFCHIAEEF